MIGTSFVDTGLLGDLYTAFVANLEDVSQGYRAVFPLTRPSTGYKTTQHLVFQSGKHTIY